MALFFCQGQNELKLKKDSTKNSNSIETPFVKNYRKCAAGVAFVYGSQRSHMSSEHSSLLRTTSKLTRDAGEIVVEALQNKDVIEILLNPDGNLWVDSLSKGMYSVGKLSTPNAMSFIATVASTLETIVTRDNPIIEGELEIDGSRFEGLTPPVVERPVFAIRKKAPQVFSLEDYVKQGTLSEEHRRAIESAVSLRRNILISGGTGSGKTTLTNAILLAITKSCPDHRIVIIEDTIELQSRAKNSVALRTSPTVTMQDLLRATMRLRPDRIVVGEVRGGEALTLVKAWNTGHPGGGSNMSCELSARSSATSRTAGR